MSLYVCQVHGRPYKQDPREVSNPYDCLHMKYSFLRSLSSDRKLCGQLDVHSRTSGAQQHSGYTERVCLTSRNSNTVGGAGIQFRKGQMERGVVDTCNRRAQVSLHYTSKQETRLRPYSPIRRDRDKTNDFGIEMFDRTRKKLGRYLFKK